MEIDEREKAAHRDRMLTELLEKVTELHSEWPEFKGLVLSMQQQQAEHERRIRSLEKIQDARERKEALDRANKRQVRDLSPSPHVRSHQQYDPDMTPMGGIRLPPDGWERLSADFEAFKNQAVGANRALDELKKNVKFYLMIAGAAASALIYVLTHFLRL